MTLLERARRHLAVEHLAQREEARVLAVDLAGMNAALHEHDRPLRAMRRRRVEHAIGGGDQREHRPAFRRAAELDAADLRRPRLLIRGTQALDFVVATGALIARLFGDGAQRRMRRRARCCVAGCSARIVSEARSSLVVVREDMRDM